MMSNAVYTIEASHLNDADACLLHSAQGLLNRDKPTLWTDWRKESGALSAVRAEQWVDGVELLLRAYLSETFDLEFQALETLQDVCSKAWNAGWKHYVLVDPDVPESLNVATTLSGIYGALVAHPEHQVMLEALGFVCRDDLTGRFLGWTQASIAQWAFDHLFPLCRQDIVLFRNVHDVRSFDVTDLLKSGALELRITSLHEGRLKHPAELCYAGLRTPDGQTLMRIDQRHIAQPHYVTGGMAQQDDRHVPTVSEYILTAEETENVFLVLQVTGVYRAEVRSDGDWILLTEQLHPPGYGQSISYSVEFSPFMRDFSVARGLFCVDLNSSEHMPEQRAVKQKILEAMAPHGQAIGWHSTYDSEHDFVLQVSQSGNTASAALSAHNFSFLQHLKKETLRIPPAPPAPKLNTGKIYLGFIVGDGDAMGICYHLMRGQLLEKGRGQVPLGMSLQLLLQDYAPGLLHFYLDHLTDQDAIFAGASGVGYCFADTMSRDDLDEYVRWTRGWVESLRPHGIYYLGNPPFCGGTGMDSDQRDIYASHLSDLLPGVIDGYIRYGDEPHGEDTLHGDFVWGRTRAPDVGNDNDWSVMDPGPLFEQLKRFAEIKQPGVPLFIPVHPWIDKKIGPDKVLEWSRELGEDFEIVRPDHLLMLNREWLSQKQRV